MIPNRTMFALNVSPESVVALDPLSTLDKQAGDGEPVGAIHDGSGGSMRNDLNYTKPNKD